MSIARGQRSDSANREADGELLLQDIREAFSHVVLSRGPQAAGAHPQFAAQIHKILLCMWDDARLHGLACPLAAVTPHCSSARCVRVSVRVCVAAAAHMARRSLFIVCWIVSARSPRCGGDGASEPPPLTAAEIRTCGYGCSCRRHLLLFQKSGFTFMQGKANDTFLFFFSFFPPGERRQALPSSVAIDHLLIRDQDHK